MGQDDLSLSYRRQSVSTGSAATTNDLSGILVGAHVGYKISAPGFVIGAESDFETSGMKGTLTDSAGGYSASVASSVKWQGSLRLRAGVALSGSSLLYATGGAAYGQVEDKYSVTLPAGNVIGVAAGTYSENFSNVRWGYTIGGGLEQALAHNFTTRIEYRFTDFGKYHNASALVPGGELNQKLQDHAVRVGASNYF